MRSKAVTEEIMLKQKPELSSTAIRVQRNKLVNTIEVDKAGGGEATEQQE